jgi:hypothetical protein
LIPRICQAKNRPDQTFSESLNLEKAFTQVIDAIVSEKLYKIGGLAAKP